MSPEIQRVLRAINRRFYDRFAPEFDASRGRPWPGWERVVDCLVPPVAVLDVGCGNGRFGAYLAGRSDGLSYLGVDACGALLRAATERLGKVLETHELRRLDVLEADFDRWTITLNLDRSHQGSPKLPTPWTRKDSGLQTSRLSMLSTSRA